MFIVIAYICFISTIPNYRYVALPVAKCLIDEIEVDREYLEASVENNKLNEYFKICRNPSESLILVGICRCATYSIYIR